MAEILKSFFGTFLKMRSLWHSFTGIFFYSAYLKIYFLTCRIIHVTVKLQCYMKWGKYPANIYLLKVSNRNTRKRCEIFSKLTITTPERRQ